MCSTACWSWDAPPTSASPDLRQGWGQCARIPDPCTTLPTASDDGAHARGLLRIENLAAYRDVNGPAKFSRHETMKMITILALVLGLAACGESRGGRAVTGGLLGAGAGAAVSGITGGSLGTGALVGGGIGAAGGALTAPSRRRSYDAY